MSRNPREVMGGNSGPPLNDNDDERRDHPYGSQGWVAVARAMRFHPLVGCGRPVTPADPEKGFCWSRYEAWQDLIMECRYESGKVNNGGRIMEIKPGQLLGAVSWLANRWNWTPKTVRNFLDKLEDEGMMEAGYADHAGEQINPESGKDSGKHKGKQARVLTICKYDIYQLWSRHKGQIERQIEGQMEGKQRANEGQHLNKGTSKQEESNPPTPQTGGTIPLPLIDPTEEKRLRDEAERKAETEARRAATRKRNEDRKAQLEAALDLFNKAAVHWGFARCDVLSDSRASRLLRRLDEIGGLEKFRIALRAIGRNDFLAGRVTPRPGEQPFRLNIDRLLQTEGGMGDVLAGLLELGSAPEVMVGPNGKKWGWWQGSEDKLRSLGPVYWRKLLDEVRPNGTWPWWLLTAPPGHPECLVDPTVMAERNLVEIYKGQIEHD